MAQADPLTDLTQRLAELRGGDATDDGGNRERRIPIDKDCEIADPQMREVYARRLGLERLTHERVDRFQHRGNLIRIPRRRTLCDDVIQDKPRAWMDQKYLLDAVYERVEQHHLGKGATRSPRLDAPAHTLNRQAALKGFVEAQ